MFEYKYSVSSHPYVPQSTMQPLSIATRDCIVILLKSGAISKICSEYCPELPKSSGGRSRKLTSANINYAKRIIHMRKADNAVQVTNQSISSQTVCRNLKEAGLQPVMKRKHPLLTKHHRKDRLDWAEQCKEYTLEDWKRVIWIDETKINRLGSDGRKWV